MFVPYVLLEHGTKQSVVRSAEALLISAFAFTAFYLIEPKHNGIYRASGARWLRQAAIVLLSTVVARVL